MGRTPKSASKKPKTQINQGIKSMSRSNDDCSFYYESECTKGDLCPFRHEPSAQFSSRTCIYWSEGHCITPNCSFRYTYTHCFPISNPSISNSTQNLGFFKEWVVKTLQLRKKKSVPNKIKECQYSQKIAKKFFLWYSVVHVSIYPI